jgi:hypothetical protein
LGSGEIPADWKVKFDENVIRLLSMKKAIRERENERRREAGSCIA